MQCNTSITESLSVTHHVTGPTAKAFSLATPQTPRAPHHIIWSFRCWRTELDLATRPVDNRDSGECTWRDTSWSLCGLTIDGICSEELFVNDLECILSDVVLNPGPLPVMRAACSVVNKLAVENFEVWFDWGLVLKCNNMDILPFHLHCPAILESVAPVKSRLASSLHILPVGERHLPLFRA